MKRPVRWCALSALGVGILLSSGCGAPTTNDENMTATGAVNDPSVPVFKTYGERQQYEAEQAAKKRAESQDTAGSKGQAKKK